MPLTHKHSSYSTPWSGLHSLCYHPGNALFQEFSHSIGREGKRGEKTEGKKRKTRKIEKKGISANVIIQSHHPTKPWGSLRWCIKAKPPTQSDCQDYILNSQSKISPQSDKASYKWMSKMKSPGTRKPKLRNKQIEERASNHMATRWLPLIQTHRMILTVLLKYIV